MSGTHGLLQPNQPGYYYITLEESYVTLFKISAEKWFKLHKNEEDAEKNRNARLAHAVAKAFITDVLVHLSNELYKTTKSDKNLWVFLSFPELENRLHGAVKIRTLKDAMREMIEDGYVFKRPNRDPRYKSLEYCLNLFQYRKELNKLPAKKDSANLHDEIDSAKMHDLSANLHDDSAKMHDDNANLHPIHNIDITKTKQREGKNAVTPTVSAEATETLTHSSTPSSFSHDQEKQETSSLQEKPSPEIARVKGYWKDLGYREEKSAAWAELAEKTKTFEEFKSLFDFTEEQLGKNPKFDSKGVHPGNMLNYSNEWVQAEKRKKKQEQAAARSQEPKVMKIKDMPYRPLSELTRR